MIKKAQAAMEYLMTYGWAILIVIVVVAALYAMGVFKIGGGGPACNPCFSGFSYIDYAGGTLIIRNGPEQRTITSITTVPDVAPAVTSASIGVVTDSGKDVTVTGVDTTGDVELTLIYTQVASGLSHTVTATVHN